MQNNDDIIVENVLKTCEHLENILNNNLLLNFGKLHNIDSKFNLLKLKQEVIASNALFLDKKIYGLFIVNKERKKVNEFDVKGMIIRKSQFPLFSKEKIKELLNLILKTDSLNISKIKEFVQDTSLEVRRKCESRTCDIAGSVSYNQTIEEYKVVPAHVKAMELWNNLEYNYFVNGTKGWLFRINGIDQILAPKKILSNMDIITHKNTAIVLPIEMEYLPEYYILDIESQMRYCWYDRIDEVLSTILKNDENENEDFINEMFE